MMKARLLARAICALLIGISLAIYLSIGPSGVLFSQDLTPRAYLASLFLAEDTPTPTVTPMPSPTPTATPTTPPSSGNRSLRFFGNGANQIDRVEIALTNGNAARPVNVGNGDFTLEFWMKADAADNNNAQCSASNDSWINGSIIFDRDVFFEGDYGDFGVALMSGRIAFGVFNGTSGTTLCGSTSAANGQWHHVAVQRRSGDGQLWIFVDGQLDGQLNGPNGRIDYRAGRSTIYPNDPFLVIGAEKHDVGSSDLSYNGFVDEVRISTALRYGGNFTRPGGPFAADGNTAALYHFNEASGTTITDTSGASGGPSNGVMNVGGNPAGPVRSADAPF
jgi:hypothetical protein